MWRPGDTWTGRTHTRTHVNNIATRKAIEYIHFCSAFALNLPRAFVFLYELQSLCEQPKSSIRVRDNGPKRTRPGKYGGTGEVGRENMTISVRVLFPSSLNNNHHSATYFVHSQFLLYLHSFFSDFSLKSKFCIMCRLSFPT